MSDKLLPDYILADSATLLQSRLREIGQLILKTNQLLEESLQLQAEVTGSVDNAQTADYTKYYQSSSVYEVDFSFAGEFKEVINATFYPQYRRWMIFNRSGCTIEFAYTKFNKFEAASFYLVPQMIYTVEDSGGIGARLIAKGDAGCKLNVSLQKTDSNPPLLDDEDMAIPIEVKPLLATGGSNYDNDLLGNTLPSSANTNFERWFGRDSYAQASDGYKVFDIVTFHPGKPIQFLVTVAPGVDLGMNPEGKVNQDINVFTPHPSIALRALLEIASDLINPESQVIPEALVGSIITNGWQASLPKEGGIMTLNPNFSQHIGLFIAWNNNKGSWDTALFNYQPSIDPYTGGTFVIVGF